MFGEPESGGLHRWLRWLSRGLIAYGITALIAAAIGISALAVLGGRVSALSQDAQATVDRLSTTIELTARTLHDASSTARSFGATVDQSAQAVSSAAATISQVRSDLSAFEGQLRSVSILGMAPLASPADAIGRVRTSMAGLDTQLLLAADGLKQNQAALTTNAASLGELGDSTQALLGQLTAVVDRASLEDLQLMTWAMLLAWAAVSLVPAAWALTLGIWLARVLRRSRPA